MEHSRFRGYEGGAGLSRYHGVERIEPFVGQVRDESGVDSLGAYYRAVESYNARVESASAAFGQGFGGLEAARFCQERFVRPVWYGDSEYLRRSADRVGGGRLGVGERGDVDDYVRASGDEKRARDTLGARILLAGSADVDDRTGVGEDSLLSGSGASQFREGDSVASFDASGKDRDCFSRSLRVEPSGTAECVEECRVVGGGGQGRPETLTTVVSGLREVRGKHYNKNKKKKNRKAGVSVDVTKAVVEPEKSALRISLEEKWRAENEVRILRARKEAELLRSEDLDAIKKLRERKVQGATERTMVQIEKAHASLVQSGDVPGVQPGFCKTVVDGEIVESVPGLCKGSGECSISPSSSISERDLRNMMKELEDIKLALKKSEKKNYRLREAFKVGFDSELPVSVVDGDVPESAREAFDEVCGIGKWDVSGEPYDPDTLYVKMNTGLTAEEYYF